MATANTAFLFSDIIGSTRLWEAFPDRMDEVVQRHDALIHGAVREAGGEVYKHTGDGMGAAFSHAAQALQAAEAAQVALRREEWGSIGALSVRMGVHVGEAERRDGYYFGSCLNHVSRLMGVAGGGQVLVSNAAATTLDDLRGLVDMGVHRLRDLSRSNRIYSLPYDGMPTDLPPLRGESAGNLPETDNELLGRDEALEQLREWVKTDRLVMLRAFGGSGKTRLAIAVGEACRDRFADGVWFLPLAPVTDPEVLSTEAAALFDVGEGSLDRFLADREMLVIVDNCEHLMDGASALIRRLLRSPGVRVVATSREATNLRGERVFSVPPLGVAAATRLFCQRARAVSPTFELDATTTPAVHEIVETLDGIPLAVELAASRMKMLGAPQIANRLHKSLKLLKGGRRDGLPHHRTLEAAIDWSYEMLDEAETGLFRQLSVFHGGFTVEAATAVSGLDDEFDLLELLGALVDKSLVLVGSSEGEARYTLLEPLRQYGAARLPHDEEAAARRAHLHHFEAMAQRGAAELRGPAGRTWLGRLRADHENFRLALGWGLDHNVDAAQRIAVGLTWFWLVHRHTQEALAWFERLLARPSSPAARAPTLVQGGFFRSTTIRTTHESLEFFEEAKKLYSQLGDFAGLGEAVTYEGVSRCSLRQLPRVREIMQASKTGMTEAGFAWGVGFTSWFLGAVAWLEGDLHEARAQYRPALEIFQQAGDLTLIAWTTLPLANIAMDAGELDLARRLYERTLPMMNDLGDRLGVGATLIGLSAAIGGDRGERLIGEAQHHLREGGGGQGVSWALANMRVDTRIRSDYVAITERYEAGFELMEEAWVAMVREDLAAWQAVVDGR